jgi:sarcosine oxidase subunit beta
MMHPLRETERNMAETADILIIGGGVMGLSIAHHLAQAKVGKVRVLEKRYIGAGSSGKSGAIIRQHYSTRLLVEMAREGILCFRDFERVTGTPSGWQNVGCLLIVSKKDRAAAEGNVALMQAAGARAEILGGAALGALMPQAQFAADEMGAWEPEAGCVDAATVLFGWAQSATQQGVTIQEGVEVLNIEIERGRVAGATTNQGRISSKTVVLCAGPWARALAARAGIDLPLTVIRPQIGFFRRPGDFGSTTHPVLGDLTHGFYCRPEAGERTLVGALDTGQDEVIADPDSYDEGVSDAFLQWARNAIANRVPAMKRSFGRGGYSGLYTLSPDSHPLLGEVAGIGGLYLAVGFSGHGFKLSPSVGRGLTELITTGAYQTLDLAPLRPTRFAENAPIRSAYEYGLLS